MKKILLFLLLLVNLQLTTDNGSLSIGFGEVAAQSMQEEYLDGVTVYGGNNWTHCGCGKYVARSAYGYHLQEECSLREILCKKCGHSYRVSSVHNCSQSSTSTTESTCQYCHKKKSQCNCRCAFCGKKVGNCWCSVTMTGKGRNIGYSVSGGSVASGSYSGSNGTEYAAGLGNTGQSSSNGKEPTYKRVPMIDLFNLAKTGKVKLLANLPSKLHLQTEDAECVVRALAFMLDYLKLKGKSVSYETIYNKLFEIGSKLCDLTTPNQGVPIVPPDKVGEIFGSYCNVNYYGNSQEKIIEFIDHNIPVATAKICPDGTRHMVTVIGYDADFFYVASGKTEDNANKVPRDELKGFMLFTVE